MKIAGLLCTKDYIDECSVFETLKELTDFVIVLDNNSKTRFPYADQCDEYIVLNCDQWEDFGNRVTLFYRAFVHQCKWAVTLDDDMIPGASFSVRQDVVDVINRLKNADAEVALFMLRALCKKEGGVYHRYTYGGGDGGLFSVVNKNPFYKKNISMLDPQENRLHRRPDCFPYSSSVKMRDLTVYHAGSSTPEKRLARYNRYQNELDSDNKFQGSYENLISEENKMVDLIDEIDRDKVGLKWSYTNGTD